ncbi:MAG: PIN domain-containing protein [Candidatus Hydrothermarchaeaceae archaeon]
MATESSYKVVLDSNFLLLPFQHGVDIFEEFKRIMDVKYEVYVTDGVIGELRRMSRSKKRESEWAKAALKIADGLKRIGSGMSNVDEELVGLASKEVLICTNDKAIKERIRKKRAPVIYLRQKKYLAIEGYLG